MEKVLQKLLMGREWSQGGYTYVFNRIVDDRYYHFYVEWVPDYWPHCYFKQKIETDIMEIINNASKYLGQEVIGIDVHVTVKGKELLSSYVPPKKLKEIEIAVNERNNIIFGRDQKGFTSKYRAYFGKRPYWGIDELNFNFNIDLYDFQQKGIPIKIKKGIDINDVGSSLAELLYDLEFTSHLDDIIYGIIEPELKISEYDIFFRSGIDVTKINGKSVDSKHDYYLSTKDIFDLN